MKGVINMEKYIAILSNLDFSNVIWQIMTPIIFSIADIVTGFIQAVINNNVDSQKMRNGLLHKVALVVILILGFIIELTFGLKIVSKSVCVFIIFMETISIAENLKKMGISLGWLTKILKEKTDNTINDNLNYLITTIDETVKDENIVKKEDTKDEKRN